MSNLRTARKSKSVDVDLWGIEIKPGEWMGFGIRLDSNTYLSYELCVYEDGSIEMHGTKLIPFKAWEDDINEHNSSDV